MQLRLTVRHTARKSAQIITVSEYSRDDILKTYGVSGERITVIPEAAPNHFVPVEDERELQRVRDTYGIKGEYILSVGSIQPRKNLARLITAYKNLHDERPGVKLPKLVLVGKKGWLYDETLRAIAESGVGEQILLTGYVLETDLPTLYSGAICFVYPSYFEGFGLPPLEAMKCGAPVIVGNQTSLPEVVGDAGLMVNPFDEVEIASTLARLIDDPGLRDELRLKGLKRAAEFSWLNTAKRTLQVYMQVADAQT